MRKQLRVFGVPAVLLSFAMLTGAAFVSVTGFSAVGCSTAKSSWVDSTYDGIEVVRTAVVGTAEGVAIAFENGSVTPADREKVRVWCQQTLDLCAQVDKLMLLYLSGNVSRSDVEAGLTVATASLDSAGYAKIYCPPEKCKGHKVPLDKP